MNSTFNLKKDSQYKGRYRFWAHILTGLNEGKSKTYILSSGSKSYPPERKEHFDHLVSMVYVDEHTRKPTETGLLFLNAYEEWKHLQED